VRYYGQGKLSRVRPVSFTPSTRDIQHSIFVTNQRVNSGVQF
jgi:hypothetical protein